MAGWVVERKPRMTLASSGSPTSVSTPPMPPQSQGAERRGRRWALRAIVIGGLAGAAWLLTGSAAQAADRDPATETSSLLGAVVNGGDAPVVNRVLQAAAQPLDTARPATKNKNKKHRGVTSVLDAPVRVLTRPVVDTVDKVTHGESDAAPVLGTAGHVVRDLTGPSRLTDGAADPQQLAPAAAPLTRTPDPVSDTTQDDLPVAPEVAEPVAPRPVPAAAAGRIADVVPVTTPAGARQLIVTERHAPHRSSSVLNRMEDRAVVAAATDTLRDTTPGGGDLPASPRVQFGALSGISTSASGAPTEGGSAAFLPAAVASGVMASHQLLRATDVEVRRFDAEAPTVSPD